MANRLMRIRIYLSSSLVDELFKPAPHIDSVGSLKGHTSLATNSLSVNRLKRAVFIEHGTTGFVSASALLQNNPRRCFLFSSDRRFISKRIADGRCLGRQT